MVAVDLQTYILPDDHTVYKFFPGKGYKFHEAVATSSIAIIDVQGLEKFSELSGAWDDKELLTLIAEDRVARKVGAGKKRPSRLVRSAGDKLTLTFLKGLFFEANQGDMIIMPDKGYMTDVLIGILQDKPGKLKSINLKDDGIIKPYFGRRVRWVGRVKKRLLSQELVNLLHSQTAFFDIGRSLYNEIYSKSLDNFVYDGQYVSTFRTSKEIFTSKDNLLASFWFELMEVLEEKQGTKSGLGHSSIYQLAIESQIDESERSDLSINVMSPGWFRWRDVTVVPLAAAMLFALAVNGVSYEDARAATATATVVAPATSHCLGEVDQSVRDYLDLLGKDRWVEACQLATRARTQATLKTDARLKN